jgi:hypothetical protein
MNSSSSKRPLPNQKRLKDQRKSVPSFLAATPSNPITWEQLSGVRNLSKNPVIVSVYIKKVMSLCDANMSEALDGFQKRTESGEEMVDLDIKHRASMIAKVGQLLESYRTSERHAFSENVLLDESRYPNERMNLRILSWICECQCNLLRFFTLEHEPDMRSSAEFVNLFKSSSSSPVSIAVYKNVPVLRMSMSQLRFAILRIMKMFTQLPMLDNNFLSYMKVLRLRTSMLQCLSFAVGSPDLDYPEWKRAIGGGNAAAAAAKFERASTDFANAMEMYFYYLSRQMDHEREMFENSQPLPNEQYQSTNGFHRWLESHKNEVLVEQLRREVYTKSILVEVIPLEREIYSKEFPTGYSDYRTILKSVRSEVRESFDRLMSGDMEMLMDVSPFLCIFYRFVFLLQSLVDNLDVRSFVFFSDDFPADQFGCAYPRPSFFTNLEYPTIYVPQTKHFYYLSFSGRIYRCKPDANALFSVWLRVVTRLWVDQSDRAHKNKNPFADERFASVRRVLLSRSAMGVGGDSPFAAAATAAAADPSSSSSNKKLSELMSALTGGDSDPMSIDDDDALLIC